MNDKAVITRRVNAEYKRLSGLFTELTQEQVGTLDGLFMEAARLRILCDEAFEQIILYGEVELKKNMHGDVLEKQRDISKVYTQRNNAYNSIMRSIAKMFPKQNDGKENEEDEAFMNWLKG